MRLHHFFAIELLNHFPIPAFVILGYKSTLSSIWDPFQSVLSGSSPQCRSARLSPSSLTALLNSFNCHFELSFSLIFCQLPLVTFQERRNPTCPSQHPFPSIIALPQRIKRSFTSLAPYLHVRSKFIEVSVSVFLHCLR